MKTQKVDASKASSIINNNALKQNKCKFVMQFLLMMFLVLQLQLRNAKLRLKKATLMIRLKVSAYLPYNLMLINH